MNNGKYVFSQIAEFLPRRVFDNYVKKYNGNKYVKHFTCWNQMLCMIFGQLTSRDSLRDLIVVTNAHSNKIYHLGLGKTVTRSNLAKANEKRNHKIFEEFAYYLIEIARKKKSSNDDFEIEGNIYAFDSSTIDLCLSVFWWANFRKTKGGIKLHTLYDVTTQIPSFVHITPAKVHDVNAMDFIPYESEAYYVFDRGYLDFKRLYHINKLSAYFVIRSKSNMKFRRIYSNKIDKATGVMYDQIGKLTGVAALNHYPIKLRRIKFFDKDNNRAFIFLTNNMELEASEIAMLYKKRWMVELFFKWIKQHLKVKSFWGESENAVRIQVFTAIISYCLVAIVGSDLKINRSTYEILQILSVSLLDKTPVNELLKGPSLSGVEDLDCNQLKFNLF